MQSEYAYHFPCPYFDLHTDWREKKATTVIQKERGLGSTSRTSLFALVPRCPHSQRVKRTSDFLTQGSGYALRLADMKFQGEKRDHLSWVVVILLISSCRYTLPFTLHREPGSTRTRGCVVPLKVRKSFPKRSTIPSLRSTVSRMISYSLFIVFCTSECSSGCTEGILWISRKLHDFQHFEMHEMCKFDNFTWRNDTHETRRDETFLFRWHTDRQTHTHTHLLSRRIAPETGASKKMDRVKKV